MLNSHFPPFAKSALLKLLHGSELEKDPKIASILELIPKNGRAEKRAKNNIMELLCWTAEEKVRPENVAAANIISTLMKQEYVDHADVLKYLCQYVLNCSTSSSFYTNQNDEVKYFAPAFAVCQRSGAGKTKSLVELGRKCLPLIYIGCGGNAKSPNSAVKAWKDLAFPKGYTDMSVKGSWAEKTLKLIFACAEYVYRKVKDGSKEGFEPDHLKQLIEEFFQPTDNNQTALTGAWSDIMVIVHDDYKEGFTSIIDVSSQKNPFKKLNDHFDGVKDDKKSWKLVLVFDEARGLLLQSDYSAFEVIRAVAGIYTEEMHGRLVIVVADTNSTITNFSPPSQEFAESSSFKRLQKHQSSNLIPPFFQLSGLDTGDREYLSKAVEVQGKWDSKSPTGPWKAFLDGRVNSLAKDFYFLGSPLWRAFHEYQPGFTFKSLFDYAASKMNGGKSDTLAVSDTSVIAALCCRVGLSILPDSVLAKDLVAGGMAQINYLTRNRHYAFIGYPSDPTLAEGAARIMKSANERITRVLKSHVDKSLVDIGMSGEVVARLLIINAMDRMRTESSSPPPPRTVSAFFKELLTSGHYATMENELGKSKIWNAELFVNHTVILDKGATKKNVAYALCRGAMITGFPQQPAWDICIPVVLPNGQLSSILLQIKNWLESIGPSDCKEMFLDIAKHDILRKDEAAAPKEVAADSAMDVDVEIEKSGIDLTKGIHALSIGKATPLKKEGNGQKRQRTKTDGSEGSDKIDIGREELSPIYVLLNFRHGQLDHGDVGSKVLNSTFTCDSTGNVFMQGSLDNLFKPPANEPDAFQNLVSLLQPRSTWDRLRTLETTKSEQELYSRQDHACGSCELFQPNKAKNPK